MNPAELAVNRRNTTAFINEDPATIVLTPHAKVSNGSGGFTLSPQPPRPQQTARLIPLASSAAQGERQTLDGKTVIPRWILLLEWDAAVARGDTFETGGWRYLVAHVQEKRNYQTKAEIASLGSV